MKVAVFGAGTMGSGIAQVFAAKGHTALMYASSVASAQRHKDKLDASLQKRVDKGRMDQAAKDAIATGIAVVKTDAKGDWYDMNGRRLNGKPATKGVYVRDGRKVVVK